MGSVSFADLVDASIPWDDGTVAMLKAYFDASSRTESGVFCVAGVAFGVDRAKKVERQLKKVFGQRRCHMTDLHARRGDFAGIDDSEADRLCRGAVGAIKGLATAVAVVSCDIEEVARLTPTDYSDDAEPLADTMRSAYNLSLIHI